MKVLITGGAGFIGSHLADALLAQGHSVVCVDDLSLGRKSNIAHNLGNRRFSFVRADINNAAQFGRVFKKHRFSCVFHLAANSDIRAGGKCPDIDLRRTFLTTYSVLEMMRLHGIKQLVFASTSAVYGEGDAAFSENDPTRPVSLYGAGKLSSEAWISAFATNFGVRAWVIRFPNVVGGRATHGVIFDFINRLRRDPSRLLILGDGRQKKPYMHVRDLVRGILFVWQHADGPFNCFNIAGEGATTVDEIARAVVAGLGLKGVKFDYTGSDRGWTGDVPRFKYDISKIRRLGWRTSMRSGAAVKAAVADIIAGL